MSRKKTHEDYLQELLDKELDFNPRESYINAHTPILHECIEGHQFKVRPTNILNNSGNKCPECWKLVKTKSHTQYEKELEEIGFKPIDKYINTDTPIKHICSKNKHIFTSTPNSLLYRQLCPFCIAEQESGYLYYVRFNYNNKYYYKIGITKHSVEKRFKYQNHRPDKVIFEKLFSSYNEAKYEERCILEKFKSKIIDFKFLTDGNTEVFNTDVLLLDSEEVT